MEREGVSGKEREGDPCCSFPLSIPAESAATRSAAAEAATAAGPPVAVEARPVVAAAVSLARHHRRREAETLDFSGALLGRERLAARELDLPVHGVDRDDLDLDLVAHLHDVGRLAHAPRRELGNVDEPVHAREDLHETAVWLDAHDRAEILGADLGDRRELADRLDALRGGPEVARGDGNGPVVLHVDLAGVFLLERADRLAAGADDVADLVLGHRDREQARRERGELGARGVQRLLHLVEDEEPAVAGLLESLLEDLRRDAADLDVHLEGRDAGTRTGITALLMSIWRAVMPVRVPATLKSMSP